MILADTSIWVDYLHKGDATMQSLMEDKLIYIHPMIIGEIALGNMRARDRVLADLDLMKKASVAEDTDVLQLIAKERLHGTGIGYIDAHLIASARLSSVKLWTRDKALHKVAEKLGIAPQIR